ncbi:MAG: DUF3105 domain-containing protein [Chloroflexi bacterium]|nr:DUF3105 domain-containing protein [Chloroflexota bacterium]
MPISRRRRGRVARSARTGNLTTTNRRKKTNKLYLLASIVIAVLVIASFAFASFSGGGGGSAQRGSAQEYIDGVGIQFPILSSRHIGVGTLATYNSTPPTSGEHWPTPERCGFFEEGLPDERIVHNLEHGNIVVSYNLLLESDVSALRGALNNIGLNNVWGVARAYDGIPPGQIGLTAWGVLDTFLGVDEERIALFFEAYSGSLGPERVPC